MTAEDLKKIETLLYKLRAIKERADKFVGSDTFFIAADDEGFRGEDALVADKAALADDHHRRLWQEIDSAILTYFRAEYQSVKKDLADLGVSFSDYRDTIEKKTA